MPNSQRGIEPDGRTTQRGSSRSLVRWTHAVLGCLACSTVLAAVDLVAPALTQAAPIPPPSAVVSLSDAGGHGSAGSLIEAMGGLPAYGESRQHVLRVVARLGGMEAARGGGGGGGGRGGARGRYSGDSAALAEESLVTSGRPSSESAGSTTEGHGRLHDFIRTTRPDGTAVYTNRPEDQARRERATTPAVEQDTDDDETTR
jgi:hypothetical protein